MTEAPDSLGATVKGAAAVTVRASVHHSVRSSLTPVPTGAAKFAGHVLVDLGERPASHWCKDTVCTCSR